MDRPVSKIGDSPRRREDPKFLTGRGAFLDDLAFEGLCHAVFLRAPHAYARESELGSDVHVTDMAKRHKTQGLPVVFGEQGNAVWNEDERRELARQGIGGGY